MAAIAHDSPSRQVRRAQARAGIKAGHPSAAAGAGDAPGEAPGKGQFDGNCERTACQEPIQGGNWFNLSTRHYYCRRCAMLINRESLRFDGIRVCVSVDDPSDRPPFPYEEMRRIRESRMAQAAGDAPRTA